MVLRWVSETGAGLGSRQKATERTRDLLVDVPFQVNWRRQKKMEFTGARDIPLKHDCLFVLFHSNTKRIDLNWNYENIDDAADMRIVKSALTFKFITNKRFNL